MAINLTKVLTQIQNRISDSATTARDLNKLIAAANRINNSGTQVLTYQSTGHLPSLADSNYIGVIARVTSDNVFGDSDGRYYYASGTDSGWRGFKTTQDSAEALIEAPASGGGGGSEPTIQSRNVIGSVKGYTLPGVSYPTMNTYSYTSDGNASTLSSFPNFFPGVSSPMYATASASDDTYGYTLGAFTPGSPGVETYTRFPFANEDAATALGMTAAPSRVAGTYFGHGSFSGTHVYIAGGYTPNWPTNGNAISKFAVASVPGVTATDVGDLNANRSHGSGQMASSEDDAYIAAGLNPGYAQGIDKISYSSDGNATDHGDLTVANTYGHGHTNSETHGYVHGGQSQPTTQNRIEKWPFASAANASDVGDLTGVAQYTHGTSSTTHGYRAGGSPNINIIDKYDFSSDGNATDVGDLQGTDNGYTGGVQN